MKKILLLAAVAATLTACNSNTPQSNLQRTVNTSTLIHDEELMPEVSNGLHRITLNDSTTVLIYRGLESVTMVQLK